MAEDVFDRADGPVIEQFLSAFDEALIVPAIWDQQMTILLPGSFDEFTGVGCTCRHRFFAHHV